MDWECNDTNLAYNYPSTYLRRSSSTHVQRTTVRCTYSSLHGVPICARSSRQWDGLVMSVPNEAHILAHLKEWPSFASQVA